MGEGGGEGGGGEVLVQFYAYKNHTKISCEYSAIKRWLSCQDILCIQKISAAHTIKNHWLVTKTSAICAYKDKCAVLLIQKSYKDKL